MSTIHANPSPSQVPLDSSDGDSAIWSALYDMPAWGISLLVHVAVFVVLASLSFVTELVPEFELTSEIAPEEIRQEEFVLDQEADVLGSKSDLNIVGPSMAAAQDIGMENHLEEVERLEEQVVNVEVPEIEALQTPNEAELMENIDLTGTTEFAGGTEGAVDRITQEIAASLRQRKTLVVWLFDESGSLNARRKQIADRFENIYQQLGLMDVDSQEALKTGIIGYGQNVHVLQKEPTSNVEDLVKVVRSIQEDTSGEERVFSAIAEALKTYLPEKRRMRANMMLIIVTDERGDDYQLLEDVVKKCAREGVKAYCVGNTSIFGREKGYVHATWEAEGEQFSGDIEVDQGPETAAAEGLQIPFWTASSRGLDRMSSGYGPYTLSRLCAETGGIFFIADETTGRKFDAGVMRQYMPDYRPLLDYQKQLATNMAKAALVNASRLAITEDVPIPQRSFQANNDNILREQITEAQKPLATLDYFLQQVHTALEQGEKHRDKLDSDRWRASFDLAMGRVLAMRVRAYGYNAVLAEMKSNPKRFEKSESNQWRLEPSETITAGASVRRMHDKAVEYLTRVINEHPGTPWAFLAKVELDDPLGWEWKEATMQIAQMNGGGANGPQFAPEEERRRQQARQRQQLMEKSKPKL